MATVKFVPLASNIDFSFWTRLTYLKLNVWKLDSSSKALRGFSGPELSLTSASFSDADTPVGTRSISGRLVLFDSADAFKSASKQAVLDRLGCETLTAWEGESEAAPAFVVLCFPDIKDHSYLYWTASPAIVAVTPPPGSGVRDLSPGVVDSLAVATPAEVTLAVSLSDSAQRGAGVSFALLPFGGMHDDALGLDSPSATSKIRAAVAASPALNSEATVLLFDDAGYASANAATTSGAVSSVQLGWLVRNALTMLARSCGGVRSVRALVVPSAAATATAAATPAEGPPATAPGIWVRIAFDADPEGGPLRAEPPAAEAGVEAGGAALPAGVTVVGWEPNAKGLPGPRVAHLRRQLDSAALADASADLNLSLMRWRMLPGLDLPRLASVRCLLLGAGTLGCHVARDLVAWGVRHITFVDAGDVSYSNPVRQPLYVFKDVGRPKAVVAAEALAAIRPGIDATARVLSIPMPDHPAEGGAEGAARVLGAVAELKELIATHDAVFLMTDTRESRWLPTILAAEAGKVAITVALGFDSYLVMRHGVRDVASPELPAGGASAAPIAAAPALGCYFCGDVVGPLNSTLNRSLDQQCTVTRPACAPIASAMAVELLVSLLHHPLEGRAPADVGPLDLSSRTSTPLGALPHQIRGFLTHYAHLLMANPGFDKCTACSPAVLAALESGGPAFLLRVFDEGAAFLERITGLDALQASTAALELEDLDGFDEEDGECA